MQPDTKIKKHKQQKQQKQGASSNRRQIVVKSSSNRQWDERSRAFQDCYLSNTAPGLSSALVKTSLLKSAKKI